MLKLYVFRKRETLNAKTILFPTQQGSCTFGDNCTYRHDCSQEGSIEEAKKKLLCPYFLKDKCRHRERCWFSHESKAEKSHGSSKSDEELAEFMEGKEELRDIAEATAAHATESADPVPPSTVSTLDKKTSEMPEDEAAKCGICLEHIVMKGERFALFSNCSHSFCYQCARSWHRNPSYRKSRNAKGDNNQHILVMHSCPLCRVDSEYLFPSKEHYIGAEKDAYIAKYKEERNDRKCKFFDGNTGSCPFGKECFYAHLGEDGSDLKPIDVKKSEKEAEKDASDSSDESDGVVYSTIPDDVEGMDSLHNMEFAYSHSEINNDNDDFGTSSATDRYNNQDNEYDTFANLFAQETQSPPNDNALSLGNMLSAYREENDNSGNETSDWLPQLNMFSTGMNIGDQDAHFDSGLGNREEDDQNSDEFDFQKAMEEQLRRLGNI